MLQEFVKQSKNMVNDMISDIHTAMPATIVSFDPGSCTATILPKAQIKDNNGKKMDYPQVSGVPVVMIQAAGQGATIAMPVKAGDGCLFVVAEQALDYWMYGKETGTNLKFDLSSGIAIPGLFVAGNSVVEEACTSESIIIDNNGTRIAVSQGNIAIRGDVSIEGNLTITGTIDASGDVSGASTSLHNHTHSGVTTGGGSTGKPT